MAAHIYGLKVGSCVVTVNRFPNSLEFFGGGNLTTINMAVCVLQSVGLDLFAWLLLLPRLLLKLLESVILHSIEVFFAASLSCSESVINVKEGLMKFSSKPSDALQREKNSKLKHSTKVEVRRGVKNSVLKLSSQKIKS